MMSVCISTCTLFSSAAPIMSLDDMLTVQQCQDAMSRTEVLWKDRFKPMFSASKGQSGKGLQQGKQGGIPELLPDAIDLSSPDQEPPVPDPAPAIEKPAEIVAKSLSTEEAARILASRLPVRTEECSSRVPVLKLSLSQLDTDAAPERRPLSPVQAHSPPNDSLAGAGGRILATLAQNCVTSLLS